MTQGLIQCVQRPSAVGGLLRRPQTSSGRRKYSHVVRGLGSMDGGSEDEDTKLVREFEMLKNKIDPQNNAKLAAHLNLIWSVSERKRPERCECCSGSGERECPWCHGTGAMTVGDTLFCTHEGCRPCPVCKGGGNCKCEACRGTGKRAAWMAPQGCTPPSLS